MHVEHPEVKIRRQPNTYQLFSVHLTCGNSAVVLELAEHAFNCMLLFINIKERQSLPAVNQYPNVFNAYAVFLDWENSAE